MNICRGGKGNQSHEEIVHTNYWCPLCRVIEEKACEIADLEDLIHKMQEKENSKKEVK